MGRWRTASLLFNQIATIYKSSTHHHLSRTPKPNFLSPPSAPAVRFYSFRTFSAVPSRVFIDNTEFDSESHNFVDNYELGAKEDEDSVKIPIKAYFLSTSINLKTIQAENLSNVLPPSSRSTNYVALRFCDFPSETAGLRSHIKVSSCRYMVIFQYGSAVLFNIDDHEVETYLEIVKRHASGLLPEMRKDDYALKEKPQLVEDMQGGPDYIVVKALDTDGIRIIGSVLGQSIALDYFVSQVDGILEEFTDINRGMEKTGTFTMNKKKLLQLVGKANSNLADVILKVGLFERSEIAWRDAKYAQIHEYLREEYEVTQRFGNLDYKLKFVEHNIHFLQEVLQNRKSDFLEWCIIGLLTIENVISIYEIIRDSSAPSL
ncbi:Sporulation RMD1 [Quillaja saponaria]|uniref:Sporulation RMD1 n=1 Tax=Quillaja saponaria TaxID=32244 RepID=A0AAD7KPT0_QUISA|nr:Sporulation RMD1 [Quillaja saponaria]